VAAAQSLETSAAQFFDERVAPIVSQRCLGCHNDELKDGGISFMDRESLLKGGSRGPAIVPGKPAESVLIHAVRQDGELKMPPGAQLSEQDIATLTEWIERGAIWGKAVKPKPENVRLPPTVFRELPKSLAQELQRLGCAIPQTTGLKEPHNVIRGEFAKAGQTDWAARCGQNGVSTILVFWHGSRRNPSRIARMEDGPSGNLFLRRITPASAKSIVEHDRAYGGPKPPAIDHQGIEDSIFESASVIHYYFRGKWLRLTGAD
jgi:hypothetical protein